MSYGSRPGGLTALAIINFVMAGLEVLGILGNVTFLFLSDEILANADSGMDEIPSQGLIIASIVFGLAAVTLLIMSGIGYFGLKKRLGYVMGNLYALIAIVAGVMSAMAMGFMILSLISFIYPVVTLFLLNIIFKEDFVN